MLVAVQPPLRADDQTRTASSVPASTPTPAPPRGRLILLPARVEDPALKVESPVATYQALEGEQSHVFTVKLANASESPVVIKAVHTSCGCSVATLPSQPWTLLPGATGEFQVSIDFEGKRGTLTKTATVDTLNGFKEISFVLEIPPGLIHEALAKLGDAAVRVKMARRSWSAAMKVVKSVVVLYWGLG